VGRGEAELSEKERGEGRWKLQESLKFAMFSEKFLSSFSEGDSNLSPSVGGKVLSDAI
jgi:hypothetical protein